MKIVIMINIILSKIIKILKVNKKKLFMSKKLFQYLNIS